MAQWWNKDTVAVVTGANKGIGYYIARRLAKSGVTTIMTARNPSLGEAALAELRAEGLTTLQFHQCDITDAQSVETLASWLDQQFGGLDVLVNNAGFAYKGDAFGPAEARTTIGVNYHGTKRITEQLLPLLKKPSTHPYPARIVNVASRAGRLTQVSPSLQAKFRDPALTVEQLSALLEKFVADIEAGKHQEEGWSNSMYGLSKVGEIAYTKIVARDSMKSSSGREVMVAACCPGYCKTDMSSQRGTKSADEGADTPTWLALEAPMDASGGFYSDRRSMDSEDGWK